MSCLVYEYYTSSQNTTKLQINTETRLFSWNTTKVQINTETRLFLWNKQTKN